MCRVTFTTSIGRCAIRWHEAGLTGFELPEASGEIDESAAATEIQTIIEKVQRHVNGEPQDFSDTRFDFSEIPAFQRAVLKATLAIKAGETRSYGEIARTMNLPPAASRAVGAALGANPWPLLIPCHRVVAADGKMTGFSGPGGIKTKLRLLSIEGAQLFAE